MKKICALILALAGAYASAAEFSGQIQTLGVGPSLGNIVLVRVVGQSAGVPWSVACSQNGFWTFKLDLTTPGASETYSQLLAAYMAKTNVVIAGTGTCTSSNKTFTDVHILGYTRFYF
jgi:hypothetical protein